MAANYWPRRCDCLWRGGSKYCLLPSSYFLLHMREFIKYHGREILDPPPSYTHFPLEMGFKISLLHYIDPLPIFNYFFFKLLEKKMTYWHFGLCCKLKDSFGHKFPVYKNHKIYIVCRYFFFLMLFHIISDTFYSKSWVTLSVQ